MILLHLCIKANLTKIIKKLQILLAYEPPNETMLDDSARLQFRSDKILNETTLNIFYTYLKCRYFLFSLLKMEENGMAEQVSHMPVETERPFAEIMFMPCEGPVNHSLQKHRRTCTKSSNR